MSDFRRDGEAALDWAARYLEGVGDLPVRASVRPGETAAVVGVGTLGLLALQVLRSRAARVLCVGRTGRRFPLARELGAEAVHATSDGELASVARK